MNEHQRIEIGSQGLGAPSPLTIEERATQIALMDGRAEANDLDREEALRQINDPASPRETSADQIAEGDRPDAGVAPSSRGAQAEKVPLENESNISEKLVQEGVEEAEFDTRLRAAENSSM
ncbi:MAG TPA: hypothetical protein VIS99_17885 [Terrimicrobiaceae bacterium]